MEDPSYILTVRNVENLEQSVGASLLSRCRLLKSKLNVVPRRSTLRLRVPSPYLWLSLRNAEDYLKLSDPEVWSFLDPVAGKTIQVQKVVRGKWPLYIHDIDLQLSRGDIVKILAESNVAVDENIQIRTFKTVNSPSFSCVLSVATERDYHCALEQRVFSDSLEVTSFVVAKCRSNKPIYERPAPCSVGADVPASRHREEPALHKPASKEPALYKPASDPSRIPPARASRSPSGRSASLPSILPASYESPASTSADFFSSATAPKGNSAQKRSDPLHQTHKRDRTAWSGAESARRSKNSHTESLCEEEKSSETSRGPPSKLRPALGTPDSQSLLSRADNDRITEHIERLVREKDRRVEELICEHVERHGKEVDQLRSEMEALKRVHASEIDALQKQYADQVTELNTERVLLASRVDELERKSSINITTAQHQPPSETIHMRANIQQLQSKMQEQELRLKSISHAAYSSMPSEPQPPLSSAKPPKRGRPKKNTNPSKLLDAPANTSQILPATKTHPEMRLTTIDRGALGKIVVGSLPSLESASNTLSHLEHPITGEFLGGNAGSTPRPPRPPTSAPPSALPLPPVPPPLELPQPAQSADDTTISSSTPASPTTDNEVTTSALSQMPSCKPSDPTCGTAGHPPVLKPENEHSCQQAPKVDALNESGDLVSNDAKQVTPSSPARVSSLTTAHEHSDIDDELMLSPEPRHATSPILTPASSTPRRRASTKSTRRLHARAVSPMTTRSRAQRAKSSRSCPDASDMIDGEVFRRNRLKRRRPPSKKASKGAAQDANMSVPPLKKSRGRTAVSADICGELDAPSMRTRSRLKRGAPDIDAMGTSPFLRQ